MRRMGGRMVRWLAMALAFWAAQASAAEVGVTEDHILLGQSAAFSGPAAQLGIQMNLGARVYFDQVNRAGGINGRKIEIKMGRRPIRGRQGRGQHPEIDRAGQGVRLVRLCRHAPPRTRRCRSSPRPRCRSLRRSPGANSLREPFNRYVFNIRASYFDETAKIVEYLTTVGIKNIAVFYQNDAYGKTGLDGTARALEARKLKVVATASVERNSVDVTKAVDTMMQAQPDAIVLVSAYSFVRGLHQGDEGARVCGPVPQPEASSAARRSPMRLGSEGPGGCDQPGDAFSVRGHGGDRTRIPKGDGRCRAKGPELVEFRRLYRGQGVRPKACVAPDAISRGSGS